MALAMLERRHGRFACWILELKRSTCFQQALAEMLHQNRTIKEIVLSSNRITTVGAKAPFEPSFAAFGFGFFEVAGVAGGTPSQQGCHVHLSQ